MPKQPACDHPSLDEFVGYNLKRAYMIFQADFREALGKDGLSPRSYSALSLAVQNANITQSELARRLGIERSGLVAIVDQLEEAGLLCRVGVPGDRRVQALTPTQEGLALFARASKQVATHEDRLTAVLSDGERDQLLTLLRKLRNSSEAQE